MRTWYNIQATAGSDTAVVSILDEIGVWGVTAEAFIKDLKAVSQPKITVEINSPGGDVFAALAIYNALRASGKTVHTKALGLAASAASLVLMAGDTRSVAENGFVMIHSTLAGAYGHADDLRDMADLMDKVNASLRNTYVARTGRTPEEVDAMMSKDTFLSASEAKAQGFVDEIDPALELKASFELDRLPAPIKAAFESVTDPEPEDVEDEGDGFIEPATAAIKEAGLEAYAGDWLLACESLDQVQGRIKVAREVQALCKVLNVDAAAHIKAGTSLKDVRAALLKARSESTEIDTSQPPQNKQTEPKASEVKTSSIWAKRKKQVV